jgi:hypothetical protein
MPHCTKCASFFVGELCPRCGSTTTTPTAKVDQSLDRSFWVLTVAGIVMFFATLELLDRPPVLLISSILWFGPLIVRYIATRRAWGESHQRNVGIIFRWAALAMICAVAIIIANHFLDRTPATEIQAYVLAKGYHSGKGGPSFTLTVGPSWRVGRDSESLDVGRDVFSRANVGNAVSIDVHPGLFHLPWYNNVSPK